MTKTLVAIAIAAATLGTIAVAGHSHQGFGCDKDPQQMTERKISRMTDRLGLTTEQQSQFREILTARHVEKQAQLDTTLEQVLAVLNNEQREKVQGYMNLRDRSSSDRDQQDVERFVERQVRRLSRDLDLSEQQQSDIAEILAEEHVERLEQHQATSERISGLLTGEQLTRFEALPERREHHRFRGHHHGGNIEHRIDRMTRHLGLDEQQQQQLREIFTQQQPTRQQQRDETFDQLSAVLTDDQKTRFEEFRYRFSEKQ